MPIKRPQFVNREIYHVFNRGVEKRDIFQEISDYFRFISFLYEFNDEKEVKHRRCTGCTRASRMFIVEILAFCLMPNHYHLILQQLVEGGISLFMKKIGDGFTGYFNKNMTE